MAAHSVAVHHEVSGPASGPAVILAPSLGTDLSIWEPQARSLADRHRVVRYDLRGHGGSPGPAGPYSIDELGADLLTLLDRLGLASTVLCGTSIGAMSCMWVAAHSPERVERLVVCCSSAKIETEGRYRARALRVREGGMETVADSVLSKWFTPPFAAGHPELLERMRRGLLSTPVEGYAGCCEALASLDLRDDLAAIKAPTLVIAGAQDQAAPPEHSERIASAIPGARLELVDGAAHLANIEQPQAVQALIAEHLELRMEECR